MAVFVLDKRKKPLMPCSEKRARLLLERGRARVHRMAPFTIRLINRKVEESVVQPVSVKLDPGSKFTGIAVTREEGYKTVPLWFADLKHRGTLIRKKLEQRANFRRGRRNRNLRYRAPRFLNRTKASGCLAPSLQHRVDTVSSWVNRLTKLVPLSRIVMELVRFDTQRMQNENIEGVQYQQGTLAGYEVREYLLEKWGRKCAYCGAENVLLEIEHIVPRANGGSNRVSNLTLACHCCNQKKGAMSIEKFLHNKPATLKLIKSQMKTPLKDTAAVNSTRWKLWRTLSSLKLPVACGSGGQTKWNRMRFGVPKDHCLDALCVGNVLSIGNWQTPVMHISCAGRGSHKRTRTDKYGFPVGYCANEKRINGFATGDIVKAVVPNGKKAGIHTGRVAVRSSGSFNIQTTSGIVQGISYKYCKLISRNDGYGYHTCPLPQFLPVMNDGVSLRSV